MAGIFSGIQTIINNFQTIIQGIKLAIQFLINMVNSLISLLELIGTTIANTTMIIATLPPWLLAYATCGIGVAVLYLMVGRNTGK